MGAASGYHHAIIRFTQLLDPYLGSVTDAFFVVYECQLYYWYLVLQTGFLMWNIFCTRDWPECTRYWNE